MLSMQLLDDCTEYIDDGGHYHVRLYRKNKHRLSRSKFIKLTWQNGDVVYANQYEYVGTRLHLKPSVIRAKLSPRFADVITYVKDPDEYKAKIRIEYCQLIGKGLEFTC